MMRIRLSVGVPVGLFACALLVSSVTAQEPAAQEPAAKTGKAEISGVVVDSLHMHYLAGADVIIEGVQGTVVTDSVGRFRMGGLPPGTYQVGIFHPLLDTIGTSLATKPFRLGPDSATFLILAVPSAPTIIRQTCQTASGEGRSAVIGHVSDPETLQPVAGAEVSIAWIQIEASKQVGIKQTPHLVRDTTNASGAFHICGLPSSLDASLQARKGTAETAEVPVSLGEGASELVARALFLSLGAPGAALGNATVSGKVVLEGSSTGAGSRVELVGTEVVALTNEAGEFTMTNLPSGSRVLLARHLGYGAQTVPVDLTSHEPQKVTIKLPKFVAIMDPVLVTARRNRSLDRIGFNQRKRIGTGYFLGPETLTRMNAIRLTDIFRLVPGLRVTSDGFDVTVTSSRGSGLNGSDSCVQYFVDDMPWTSASPGDIDSFVNGNEVVALEVYQGPGVPAQYTRGMGGCVTIVLWTRFKIRD